MIFDFFIKKKQITRIMIVGILIIFTAIVSMCCVKTTKPKEDKFWKHYLHSDVLLNFITNAKVINDKLYCSVKNFTLVYEELGDKPIIRTANSMSAGFDYKPIMNDDFVAFFPDLDSSQISFSSLYTNGLGNSIFSKTTFGDQYENSSFIRGAYYEIPFGVFHGNRFYSMIMKPNPPSFPDRYIVYVDYEIISSGRLRFPNVGVFDFPLLIDSMQFILYSYYLYEERVYISFATGGIPDPYYIIIEPDGSYKLFFNLFEWQYICSFFEYKGYLFANTMDGLLYYTSNGENWTYLGFLKPANNYFYIIDDYLFMHLFDKIYFIEGEVTDMKLYHLPTSNLYGTKISSIVKFQENLVITTNYGIFSRPMTDIEKNKILISPKEDRGLINFNIEGES